MLNVALAPVVESDAVALAEQFVDELFSDAGIQAAPSEVLVDADVSTLPAVTPRRSATAEPATLYRRS
jgi:hypothetical protein